MHASFDDPGLESHAGLVPVMALAQRAGLGELVAEHVRPGGGCGVNACLKAARLMAGMAAGAGSVSTPRAARGTAARRLRGGNAASARGAAGFAARALTAARACGATGTIVVRLDSGFYAAGVIAAIRRGGAFFSVTVPLYDKVCAPIAAVPEDAWTPIRYPRAIWDDQLQAWVSDAEVAETAYTAFAHDSDRAVTARLIIRRVRGLNKKAAAGQGELFWRYHAVLTDSPFELIQAEGQHRDHAIEEQVFADWTGGPLAHLPSGRLAANAASLPLPPMPCTRLPAPAPPPPPPYPKTPA